MKRLVLSVLCLAVGASAPAENGPRLSVDGLPKTWLQGEEIQEWETNTLYIIECWATWCGPCIGAIPHVESLHLHYKNDPSVQLVGINVFDSKSPEVIKKFLAQLGTPPTYPIAIDTDQRTAKKWLEPLDVTGIPFSCAVRNGHIVWRGHPNQLSIKTIDRMKNPSFSYGDPLEDPTQKNSAHAHQVAFELYQTIWSAIADNDHARVESLLSTVLTNDTLIANTKRGAFSVAAQHSFSHQNPVKGNDYLARMLTAFPADPHALNQVVHLLLSNEEIPLADRDLSLAEKALHQAIERQTDAPETQARYYDQLADIALLRGDFNTAFDLLASAIRHTSAYRLRHEQLEKVGQPKTELPLLKKPEHIIAAPANPTETFVLPADTPKATGPDTARANELLSQVEWLRGSFPFLPADKPVFIELWRPQSRGERAFLAYHAIPGEILKTRLAVGGISPERYHIAALSIENPNRETVATVMNYSYNRNSIPIAFPGSLQAECNAFFLPEKYDDYPLAAIFAAGHLIWKGPIETLPDLVIETIFGSDSSNLADLPERLAEQQTKTRAGFAIYRDLLAAARADNAEKQDALEQEFSAFTSMNGFFRMSAAEWEATPFYKQKNYPAIVAVFQRCLDDFPEDTYVANRIYKYATSDIELRDPAYELIRRCADVMIRNNLRLDPDYNAAWHHVVATAAARLDRHDEAIAAAEAAIAASSFGQRIEAVRAGRIPLQR